MIKLYNFDELKPEEILNRDIRAEKNVEDVVDGIIADVRARGDDALKDYALKFDGAKIDALQVTQEEIDEAFAGMDPYFLETLREAAANIESFHRQQVHKNFVVNDKPGIVLGQKYTPIEKAGVYVPGGTAAYPSTVLMDVIPAKVAGVSEIVMTTPAGKDGRVNPVILAAAATAGVTKIFKTGGAQAVAALAYGTQSIPAVDKIVGPGNIYVATAKRKVFGKVGIDMIAGPSEILVLADGGCNPAWVAADLLSQAEHDKLASPVLVTDSPELAKAVQAELEVQIPQLPRAAIARASVDDNGKIILCTDLHKAIEACNIIAPEHLEVCVEDPFGVLNEIRNAGSVILGMVYNYLPYMIMPLYTVIVKLDPRLIEAAQDLGCDSAQVFRRVVLPLSMPGIVSGITMVFVPAVSTFYISQKLGGTNNTMIGDVIELQFKGSLNRNFGAAMSLVLMLLVFVSIWLMNRFTDDEEGVATI